MWQILDSFKIELIWCYEKLVQPSQQYSLFSSRLRHEHFWRHAQSTQVHKFNIHVLPYQAHYSSCIAHSVRYTTSIIAEKNVINQTNTGKNYYIATCRSCQRRNSNQVIGKFLKNMFNFFFLYIINRFPY